MTSLNRFMLVATIVAMLGSMMLPVASAQDELLLCQQVPVTGPIATEGDDVLVGTPADDVIDGLGGNDVICGLGGNDNLIGGAGEDRLFGGEGDDTLDGGDEDDEMNGGPGDDSITGQQGNDLLIGDTGNDTLEGGDGADRLRGNGGDDILNGGAGDDNITGGQGNDVEDGGEGDDFVSGGQGDDIVNGGDGDDVLLGKDGNDELDAGDGEDGVSGGPGDDNINGGSGDDFLRGDDGEDFIDGGPQTDDCIAETEINCEEVTEVGGLSTINLTADDNVAAAIAWSEEAASPDDIDTVLLARDDIYPDSLASGSIQGLLRAPLLLTPQDVLDPRTATELERLDPASVIILGGEEALSSTVSDAVELLGIAVTRVGGETRLETAIAIADTYFPNAATAIIARGYGDSVDDTRAFADSLGLAGYSAVTEIPVLLSQTDVFSTSTSDYVTSSDVTGAILVGGESALSADVRNAVNTQTDSSTELGGPNRFATAVSLDNDLGFDSTTDSMNVYLLQGEGPDAWADGFPSAYAISSQPSSPFILAGGPNLLPPETRAFMEPAAGDQTLICGPYVSSAQCEAGQAELQ